MLVVYSHSRASRAAIYSADAWLLESARSHLVSNEALLCCPAGAMGSAASQHPTASSHPPGSARHSRAALALQCSPLSAARPLEPARGRSAHRHAARRWSRCRCVARGARRPAASSPPRATRGARWAGTPARAGGAAIVARAGNAAIRRCWPGYGATSSLLAERTPRCAASAGAARGERARRCAAHRWSRCLPRRVQHHRGCRWARWPLLLA